MPATSEFLNLAPRTEAEVRAKRIEDQILAVAAAGMRPYQQQAALNRLEKVIAELRDAIDGGTECEGRDAWLTEMIADLEYVSAQIRGMK